MKSINKMAAAAVLVLSSAPMAFATTFHVTGSTAYRVADVTAEVAVCGGNTSVLATYYGSSLTGANYSVVQNASGTIKFENYFNGSIAGAEAIVDGVTTLPFPAATATAELPTAITSAGSSSAAAAGGNAQAAPSNNNTLAPYTDLETVAPDLAFCDVSFSTAQQIIKASTDTTNATPAGDAIVGVVPFVFVANGSSDVNSKLAGLSIDPQKFTYIWNSGGSATLSFLTGVNADEATSIYPLGRDADSGTRAAALAETGYGLSGSGIVTTPVAQFFPYNSATNAANNSATVGVIGVDTTLSGPVIEGLNGVPAESIDGYSMPLGDGGYYSGGNLATGLSTAFGSDITNTVVVSYLGVSDAKSAITATGTNRQAATLLAYNGVTFVPNVNTAANSALIYEGKYTFWTLEHLFSKSTATSIATSLKNSLNGGIDQLSSNGVTFAGLKVSRAAGDGSNVQ